MLKNRWLTATLLICALLTACGEDQSPKPIPLPLPPCEADQRVEANQCVMCQAGATNDAGDDPMGADTACDAAPAPDACQMNERVSANQCTPCPSGTTNDAGDDPTGADTTCPALTCQTNERVASNQCTPCPEGSTNTAGDDASGPDTMCDPAVVCRANERVQAKQCVACAAGTVSPGGDLASGPDTLCDTTFCPPDFRVQDNACIACAQGATNVAGDPASGPNTQCDIGACEDNERVSANQCVPCPTGTTNGPGDDASGANTQCDPTLCTADERVLANTCVSCPEGTTNEANDDASGPNTSCDPTLCGADERVLANTCVACPLGTTNSSDDDASGADTQCDPTICVADERVQANMCVACPADNFNAAGDDASGPDTMCVDACTGDIGVSCSDFEQTILSHPSPSFLDTFGEVVVMDGDTVAVSAKLEDGSGSGVDPMVNDGRSDSGSVHIFARSGGSWNVQAYLKDTPSIMSARFGKSLALDQDTLVVGSNAFPSASAVVFVRNNGVWTRQATLSPQTACGTATSGCSYGDQVAISGDTAYVSRRRTLAGDNSSTAPAQIEVFQRTNGVWSAQTVIDTDTAGNTSNIRLLAQGDTLFLGVPNDDSMPGAPMSQTLTRSGAVFVYTRSGGVWTQTQLLKASNAISEAQFGSALALEQDTLVIGAWRHSTTGAAYVFDRVGGLWTQAAFLQASNPGVNDEFGWTVAISGQRLLVGAPEERSSATGLNGDQSDNSQEDSGAAYLFERAGGTWQQLGYIKSPATLSPNGGPQFGSSIAMEGDTAVIGRRYGASIGGNGGSATVYKIAP